MALALYRKYRPATFAQVVGQEHVTTPLMTAVDSGRINHAYLFSGPRGCGKTSSARILARSLNCAQGPTSTPCGECQSCIDLAPDGRGNIDVIEIDAASHGGVDDARDLRERAFQLPVASRYKIYIIDEAHMVSNQGFNALLKIVEEPPESVVFIFATTEPDKVLPTIRSRTHHYPFRLVPPPAMRALLESNCKAEGITTEQSVIPLVVRAGGGSVRDSQSLLDQLISGARPEGVTYAAALGLLGVTDMALLDDMVDAIAAVDGATVFGTVHRMVDAGHDPRRFAADLLDRLRDLILLCAVPDAVSKGVIDAPTDHAGMLVEQAERLGLATLSRLADIVHVGLTEMRGTTTPRLGLELICARMLLPQASGDGGALTQRVDRLERRLNIGGEPAAATAPSAVISEASAQRTRRPDRPARAQAAPTSASATPTSAPVAPATNTETPTTKAPVAAAPEAPAPTPEAGWPQVVPPGSGRTRPRTPKSTAAQDRESDSAQSAEQSVPAQSADESVPRGNFDISELRRQWPIVLDALKRHSRLSGAMFENTTASSIDGNVLTLIAQPGLVGRMANAEQNRPLREALKQVLGVDWAVTVVAREEAEQRSAAPQRYDEEPEPDPDDEIVASDDDVALDPQSAALNVLREHLGAQPLEE